MCGLSWQPENSGQHADIQALACGINEDASTSDHLQLTLALGDGRWERAVAGRPEGVVTPPARSRKRRRSAVGLGEVRPQGLTDGDVQGAHPQGRKQKRQKGSPSGAAATRGVKKGMGTRAKSGSLLTVAGSFVGLRPAVQMDQGPSPQGERGQVQVQVGEESEGEDRVGSSVGLRVELERDQHTPARRRYGKQEVRAPGGEAQGRDGHGQVGEDQVQQVGGGVQGPIGRGSKTGHGGAPYEETDNCVSEGFPVFLDVSRPRFDRFEWLQSCDPSLPSNAGQARERPAVDSAAVDLGGPVEQAQAREIDVGLNTRGARSIGTDRSSEQVDGAQGAQASAGGQPGSSQEVPRCPRRPRAERYGGDEEGLQVEVAPQDVLAHKGSKCWQQLHQTVQQLQLELTASRYHLLCQLEVTSQSLCGPFRVLEGEREERGRREGPLEVHEFRGASAVVRWVDATSPSAWAEVSILHSIPHPHVVQFFGITWSADGQRVGIICRLPASGHLGNVLLSWTRAGNQSPPAEVRGWAVQLAKVISHVHESGYLHLDIASRHCWIDGQHGVQLFGFHGARRRGQASTELAEGTKGYVAPEVIRGTDRPTEAADVCSLGFVLYEMLTLRTPFAECTLGEIQSIMAADCRPSFSMRERSLWPEWAALVDRCWAPDPCARPPLHLVLWELEQMPEPRQRLQPLRGVW